MRPLILLSSLTVYFVVYQTFSFYGTYYSYSRKQHLTLILNSDSSFVYRNGPYQYSFGKWAVKSDTLIINSTEFTKQDSLMVAISSGSYLKIDKMVFLIRDKMLVDVKNKKKYILKE